MRQKRIKVAVALAALVAMTVVGPLDSYAGPKRGVKSGGSRRVVKSVGPKYKHHRKPARRHNKVVRRRHYRRTYPQKVYVQHEHYYYPDHHVHTSYCNHANVYVDSHGHIHFGFGWAW